MPDATSGSSFIAPKARIWSDERAKPDEGTQKPPSDRLAQRSADDKNAMAYKPDPIRAVAEDEPLRPPGERALNQPRTAAWCYFTIRHKVYPILHIQHRRL